MKYLSPIAISLFLLGCQSTGEHAAQQTAQTSDHQILPYEVATPQEISDALLADETANVIHPVDDVDLSLTDGDKLNVENDIWQHIRANLTFDVPYNDRVIAQRNWYSSHGPYLDRVAKRAEPFIYYIVQELEKNNMPLEMALLPIVESAFDPFAYSHGRASGMWQFVPDTGKRFGMEQNWWYDGRRDVIASTQGAIQYLQYLHKMFKGDWLLALAAYNSGEGRVLRAVKDNARKGKKTDFWSLSLPKETRAYVPKLLALADIVKHPEQFGVKLYEIDNQPVIEKIAISHQMDLAKAAELAGLTLGEFQRLNPGFNRWATAPDGPEYIVLPLKKVDEFKEKLSQLDPKELLSWTRYQIQNGDSLIVIAKKFDTSVDMIRQVNNIKGNRIRAGKHLLIPVASSAKTDYILSANQRLAKQQNKQQNGTKTIHIVKSGDTLWDLSRAYKVDYRSLAKWNGMAPRDTLKLGQKLVVWQKTEAENAEVNKPQSKAIVRQIRYKVRSGDSLAKIADKFQVTIADIERWNNLNRKKYLQPGQLLKLSVDVTNI